MLGRSELGCEPLSGFGGVLAKTLDGFELGYTTEDGVECQRGPARNGG